MLTCPICDAAIDQDARVCPACRVNLTGGSAPRTDGAGSNTGGVAIGIVVGILLIAPLVVWMMIPARAVSTAAARRMTSQSHLQQLALGIHHYHEEHGSFPVSQAQHDASSATHGWQTRILPYVEELAVHRLIDFDLAWDDPANRDPMRKRINLYLNPQITPMTDARGYPLIHYAGNSHVLECIPPLAFSDITDGTSNTILIGEVTEGLRAWGEPGNVRDPALGLNRGPKTFGAPWNVGSRYRHVQFVAANGAVHLVAGDTPLHVLEALATPAGGERVTFPDE